LSSLHLIRHGQAGTRINYDALSPLGREQARLLGEYWAGQKIEFVAAFTGALARQRQTAAEVCAAYARAGIAFPVIESDPCWNEFDLDGVYRDLAPVLAAEDPVFRAEYEEMLAQLGDDDAPIHRRWSRCDLQVVRAWVEGRHPSSETWRGFRDRVGGAFERLARFGRREQVAVFTSATPMGVWAAMALGVDDRRAMRLAGVLYNSAYLTLRFEEAELALFSFNNIPHLHDPALRSFR
jgi:broad specificity phosphatase PhoE